MFRAEMKVLAALVLVTGLAFGTTACGDDEGTEPEGTGGTGGSGTGGTGGNGNGGNGGTGGGDVGGAGGGIGDLCDGVTCSEGEVCNEDTGACGCTTTPDSCEAANAALDCNPNTRRCEPVGGCTPACTFGENCVLGGAGDALCVCDPANDTCAAGFACSAATLRCEPEQAGDCAPACRTGETCNDVNGVPTCECESAPVDSCPDGFFCNVALRCEANGNPTVAEEFGDCTTVGEVSGEFECNSDLTNTPVWLRPCGTGADCVDTLTTCLAAATGNGLPFCWYNYCDVDSIGPQVGGLPGNGEFFGGCDTDDSILDNGEVGTGTCLPLCGDEACTQAIGICFAGGTSPAGGSCEPDATRRSDANAQCAQGALCLSNTDTNVTPCTTVADCGQNEYCAADGTCSSLGFCGDMCNAAGGGVGDAGCGDPTATCLDLSGGGTAPDLIGYCFAACDMFDAAACPAVDGQERACFPFFDDAANPLAGACIDQAAVAKGAHEACDDEAPASECSDGAVCAALFSDGTTPAQAECVPFCECTGGFNAATGACNGASTCAGTDICSAASETNTVLGVCIETCDMFDMNACPAVNGSERTCMPAFGEGASIEGRCMPQASATVDVGQSCDDLAPASVCVDGAICAAASQGGNPNCLAWCDCADGFDATTGACNVAVAACGAGTCTTVSDPADPAANTRVGICL